MKWLMVLLITGCTVQLKRPIPVEIAEAIITFNQVKPVLLNRCFPCHNWINYAVAYPNRNRIKLRLLNKTMPPNNLMLANERELVILWINQGSKP